MTFLHMHHAMANKAMKLVAAEATNAEQFCKPGKTKLRELVLSGAVDCKSRWEDVRHSR